MSPKDSDRPRNSNRTQAPRRPPRTRDSSESFSEERQVDSDTRPSKLEGAFKRRPTTSPPFKRNKKIPKLSDRPKSNTNSNVVRLQKFLADCGVGSRRKMEELILEGRVMVNGHVTNKLGSKVNMLTDKVLVNRKPVKLAPRGIMLLNKPRGVVSTLQDPEGRPTIADFLTKHYNSYFPVGRLDWDSTGLMILTNDGDLAERLMHPRYQFDRVYHARLEGNISEATLDKIEQGVKLRDGIVYGVAQFIDTKDDTTWVEIRVREGRNRLVRRLFEKLGYPVMKLKRVGYGPFKLGKLDVGQVRVLTEKEYRDAHRKVMNDSIGEKIELKKGTLERESTERRERKKKGRTRVG